MLVPHDKNVAVGPKRVDTKPAWCNNNNSNSQIIVANSLSSEGVTSVATIGPTSVTLIPSISNSGPVSGNGSNGGGGADSDTTLSGVSSNLLYSNSFQNHQRHHHLPNASQNSDKTYQTLSSIDNFEDWQQLEDQQHQHQHVGPTEFIQDGDAATSLDLAHHIQFGAAGFEASMDEQYEYIPGYYSLEALPPHEAFEGGLLFYSDGVGPMEVISNDEIGYQNPEFIHTDGETFFYQPAFYESEVTEAIPAENALNYSYYLQQCCERSKEQNCASTEFLEAPKIIYENEIPLPVLQARPRDIEDFSRVTEIEEPQSAHGHGRIINRIQAQPLVIQTEMLPAEATIVKVCIHTFSF